MNKKVLASALLLSMVAPVPVYADVNPVTKTFIEGLDERLSIEESKSGYSITMDITDSNNNIQDDVRDFYWYIVQLLNETSTGNDLIEKGQFTCFMKQGREFHGFYVSNFENRWKFSTREISQSSTDVCTPFAGVFEHTYDSVFGGHDYENIADLEIYKYLKSQNVECEPPESYMNGCYWLYSHLGKGCTVTMYPENISAWVTVDNSFDAGVSENKRLSSMISNKLPFESYYEYSMPYKRLLLNYVDTEGNSLAEVEVDLTISTNKATIDDSENQFVDGFCS